MPPERLITPTDDPIILEAMTLELGPQLPRPDEAVVTEYSGQLVVARYLNEDGGLMVSPANRRAKDYEPTPLPPIIGHIDKPADNPDFFAIHGLGVTTSIVPYARLHQPYPYLIRTARIIEPG